MTDVSLALMGLLMTVGLLLAALKAVPLITGRAFIYAGAIILCAHAIGIKVVAPISEAAAGTLSWIALFLMGAVVIFFAGRGLVRTVQKDKCAVTRVAN